ncbi:hypothetical protein EG329_004729 [Mollisiaceae sp. DMI_Dod_QoI]|nr:hypothetical protein EG329_004729 [Helotiales sp. DMI_Dod_QoI]
MFHSWLMETESTFTPPISQNAPSIHDMADPGRNILPSSYRNSESLDFQMSNGSLSNDQSTINPNFDHVMSTSEQLPDAADVDLSRLYQTVETSQTERQESICWLERSSSIGVQSFGNNQSNSHEIVAITPEIGTDLLSELSIAMKQSSKFAIASWQALAQVHDHLPSMLERRSASSVSELIKENFLWSRIASYAIDFDKSILPPFVHRRCLMKDSTAQNLDFANLPEPLANCKNIIAMYLQKTPACTQLVHKTLLLEVQRLHTEFHEYDESTTLYSLQALTIYVILLAADRDHCNLLRIITRVAMGEIAHAVQKQGYYCVSEKRGNFPTWDDWVLQESKRRTLIVLHLMDRLIYINIGKPASCTNLNKIPLPCSKQIWLAQTPSSWEDEYKKYLSLRHGSEMPDIGGLQEAYRADARDFENDLVQDLSKWSKEVEDLGSLLLMAI